VKKVDANKRAKYQASVELSTPFDRDSIKFCSKCGEYLLYSGECSNPGCPEEIKDLEDDLDEE